MKILTLLLMTFISFCGFSQIRGPEIQQDFITYSFEFKDREVLASHPIFYPLAEASAAPIEIPAIDCPGSPIYMRQKIEALAMITPSETGLQLHLTRIEFTDQLTTPIEAYWVKKSGALRQGRLHQKAQRCFSDYLMGLVSKL